MPATHLIAGIVEAVLAVAADAVHAACKAFACEIDAIRRAHDPRAAIGAAALRIVLGVPGVYRADALSMRGRVE